MEVACHYDGYCRKGADESGVDCRSEHRYESFAHGFGIHRRSVHHSCRTDTCLVDIHGAACADDGCADNAADACLQVERAVDDGGECGWQQVKIGDYYVEHHQKVASHHYGHYLCGNVGYAFQPSEHHNRHDGADTDTDDEAHGCGVGDAEQRTYADGCHCFGELVGLHQGKTAHHSRYGEHHRKRLHPFAETFGNHIHRSALHFVTVVLALIHYGKCALEKFCRHSEKCAHPHPEDGSWTADNQSYRHAGDVAQSYGRRDGAHQCLE